MVQHSAQSVQMPMSCPFHSISGCFRVEIRVAQTTKSAKVPVSFTSVRRVGDAPDDQNQLEFDMCARFCWCCWGCCCWCCSWLAAQARKIGRNASVLDTKLLSDIRNAQTSLQVAIVGPKLYQDAHSANFVYLEDDKSLKFASLFFPSQLKISQSIPKPCSCKKQDGQQVL